MAADPESTITIREYGFQVRELKLAPRNDNLRAQLMVRPFSGVSSEKAGISMSKLSPAAVTMP